MTIVKKKGSTSWAGSRRWTVAEARAALEALDESGETVARFAARHGVQAQRLYAWRRQLAKQGAPRFIEVTQDDGAAGSTGVFEIVVGTGEVIRVPPVFDDDVLRRVLAATRGGHRC